MIELAFFKQMFIGGLIKCKLCIPQGLVVLPLQNFKDGVGFNVCIVIVVPMIGKHNSQSIDDIHIFRGCIEWKRDEHFRKNSACAPNRIKEAPRNDVEWLDTILCHRPKVHPGK